MRFPQLQSFVSNPQAAAATLVVLTLLWCHEGRAFTVMMPDSGGPSALVDTPQTGFSMNTNRAKTDPREQEAVYDIMKATGNRWATTIPDVCKGRWHGIECMPDEDQTYHVVSLSFGALSDDTAFPTCDQSQSFISPSLTKLPHIRSLFFYRCFTYNPQRIPPFLGQLAPTLQSLVLRENGHVGPIPAELRNLTWLRVLDLHANNLTSLIPSPLGRLTRLRSLDLSGNRLTGKIPNLSFPNLNVLDLSNNLLQGPIPRSLGNCPSLIKMDLSGNRLSGNLPDSFQGLKRLLLLDLSHNSLSGLIPVSLWSLTSLQSLILNSNSMKNATFPGDAFAGFKNLMILVLSDMGLQGSIPESLGRLQSLRVIHLNGNSLNGSIPRSFAYLENLSELRLNDNQLVGSIPFRREMLWRMGGKLRLYNNTGLCYDAGEDRDAAASLVLGMLNCQSKVTTQTQHLSSINLHRQMEKTTRTFSRSPAQKGSRFSLPAMIMLFTFSFYLSVFSGW